MTVDEVRARVEDIRDAAMNLRDDEAAHLREDDLWRDVLRAVADGAADPAGLARAALATLDLEFGRYCA